MIMYCRSKEFQYSFWDGDNVQEIQRLLTPEFTCRNTNNLSTRLPDDFGALTIFKHGKMLRVIPKNRYVIKRGDKMFVLPYDKFTTDFDDCEDLYRSILGEPI